MRRLTAFALCLTLFAFAESTTDAAESVTVSNDQLRKLIALIRELKAQVADLTTRLQGLETQVKRHAAALALPPPAPLHAPLPGANLLPGAALEKRTDPKTASASLLKPRLYENGSPERAFAEYLLAWKKKNFGRMAKFTQITWRSGARDPAEYLRMTYAFKTLLAANLVKTKRVSYAVADITTTILYKLGSDERTRTITARVIRESAPYKPSRSGQWGVNPLSTLRESAAGGR